MLASRAHRSFPKRRNRATRVTRAFAPSPVPELLRADTPGCQNVLHFNNAGCSLPSTPVIDAVQKYHALECAIGGYEAAERSVELELLEQPYQALAELLKCLPEEIAVTSSATSSWQQVFLGMPLWKAGSCIVTSRAEYGSNFIAYLQAQRRFGTDIHVIKETEAGDIDLEDLNRLLVSSEAARKGGGTTLVTVTHVPTSSGRIYDAEGVGRVVSQHPGVWYLLDACQSLGHLDLDVAALGCHFLTATGRKYLRGPRGSGMLFASQAAMAALEPAAMDVRGASWASGGASYVPAASARRYEQYEMSFAAKVGLGVAARYCLDVGMEYVAGQVSYLGALLRRRLAAVEGVTVCDLGARLCGIVSFVVADMEPNAVKAALRDARGSAYPHGINVSVSGAASTRLDFDHRGLDSVVRASPHYYNTVDDIDALVRAVEDLRRKRE